MLGQPTRTEPSKRSISSKGTFQVEPPSADQLKPVPRSGAEMSPDMERVHDA